MTTIAATIGILRYTAGVWDIDPGHSEVSFSVPHMMVSKVRGRFGRFSGQIVTGEDVTGSSVTATVESASVDTGNERRDRDLRSTGFLDVESHPLWTFRSTDVRVDGGGGLVVDGDLTIKGVTRSASLALTVNGIVRDRSGEIRAGMSASTTIDRNDFGVTVKLPLDGGGVVVGENVQINLEIEAVLRQV